MPYVAASGSLNGFLAFVAGFVGAIGEALALVAEEEDANGDDGLLVLAAEEDEANGDFGDVDFGGETLSKDSYAAAYAKTTTLVRRRRDRPILPRSICDLIKR